MATSDRHAKSNPLGLASTTLHDGERKASLTCVADATHWIVMKTAAIHSRIDPETKQKAETILHRLGMSPTEAIRMFYTQITLRNGLPFTVEIPNEETEKALKDSRAGRNLERFESADALIDSWK
jgi:DNA-damage-inducible protein J